ncbi:hypothetical protein ACRCQO_15810 [Pseudomonas aeruginosa]|uniref:hypothetical protein n=1 Tax=Pseudomonas aeruginosa TaxID=287 RepID=UPI0020432AD8|nr:hypothetical protein [Pseudomonas aeruginosa]MCM3916215.1 hypothetical protein [Pseudomonas aeruginosa]MCM3928927.1 hypothetical protein [Pseudomonas aeruginosa]
MITDAKKAKILLSVAGGMTVPEAARANDVKPAQARSSISRICRNAKLSPEIIDIHANPKKYIDFATKIIADPAHTLRKALREQLIDILRLRSPDELTPKYVSNITAEILLKSGITGVAVSEIQEWLMSNNTELKRQAPTSEENIKLARRSALLLTAFGFNLAEVINLLNSAND